jgi:DNA polymerase-1
MSDKKRLFLVDAYALIFRGYYALIKNPRINSKGMDTSAILGFMNSLFDVIKREKPDHLAVCFDKGGSSERIAIFPEYKANRAATPDAIKIAVPYIHQILEGMNIPIIEQEGMEADDLIGTLAKQAEKENYEVFMVTPDKDFGQLVSENIFMYRPARMGNGIEIWGIPEVQNRFGVQTPEQVIDYLGMMGDASDNIPGLPGVGDKTAKKFIETYGSMEGLLANTHELKGKMKERIEENKELGLLSKELATINLNCDVTFDEKSFELSEPDSQKVQEIFEELEFRRLTEQFLKLFYKSSESESSVSESSIESKPIETKATSAGAGQFSLFDSAGNATAETEVFSSRKSAVDSAHLYQLIDSEFALELFVDKLSKQQKVAFACLSDHPDPLQANLIGISFSWEAHKGYYIPIDKDRVQAEKKLSYLKNFFLDTSIVKLGHQLKADAKLLHNYQLKLAAPIFDSSLAHYLVNPDMRHDLTVLSETYLNYSPMSLEDLIGKGRSKITISESPIEKQTTYCCELADLSLQLSEHFQTELKEADTLKLYNDIELPLLMVLSSMEIEGINLDVDFLNNLKEDLNQDILNLEKKIYELAGEEFNISSPKQLGDILFEKLNLVDKPKKTKTGQYSTAEDVLSFLAKDHEIVSNVIEYRGLSKLKSTYVDALPEQINPKTNRVHTEYSQTVAATGRLSSINPNLQNIPIRTERGRQIRKAFIPRNEDFILMAADYSQIELRIIAALSEETTMIESFQRGEDIHASTAAQVFGIPIEEVTREQRSNAKTVNFGIIYGVSAFGLSNQTELSRSEAKELIDTYYQTYPKLRAYMNNQVNFARDHGYVSTVLGRRRYLKDINNNNAIVRGAAERNAINAPIQGSAADIIKIAMIQIHKLLEEGNYKTKMLLQVHDELVFDMHKEERDTLAPLIKKEMENAFKLSVPLIVDMGYGDNWLQAH